MEEKYLTLNSDRNSDISAIVVEGEKGGPLIIMVHGFKANKTEDGRFLSVARKMAEYGVNSIMFAQAGCDDSKEDFINYSLTNSLDDIEICYRYMKDNYQIDEERVGMIGYSMGGRLTSIFIDRHPEIKVIGLWAAACYDSFNNEDSFLGIPVERLNSEAALKGYCDYHNSFDNTDIRLSRQFIDDMQELMCSKGLGNYKGCAFIVHGDKDVTVPYDVATDTYDMLKNCKDRKLVTVTDADHGFGAWNDRPDLSRQLTETTIEYFKDKL